MKLVRLCRPTSRMTASIFSPRSMARTAYATRDFARTFRKVVPRSCRRARLSCDGVRPSACATSVIDSACRPSIKRQKTPCVLSSDNGCVMDRYLGRSTDAGRLSSDTTLCEFVHSAHSNCRRAGDNNDRVLDSEHSVAAIYEEGSVT